MLNDMAKFPVGVTAEQDHLFSTDGMARCLTLESHYRSE
jgi:hypothetical protein